jgi:replicative DNA helicase
VGDFSLDKYRRLQRLARKLDGRRLVVFVDYLQIVSSNRGYRSKLEEVSAVSTELKRLAVDLDCAVVALAQLSRSVEQRQDKRPLLSDIRESGQIEQDADVVMMLYRDDYYNAETEKKGVLEILVPKNRNGPTGKVEVAYLRHIQKIVGLSRKAN